MNVRVNLAQRAYDILITSNDRAGLGPFARQRTAGILAFVVTDEHVAVHGCAAGDALAAAGFRPSLVVLPPGEEHKALATVSGLYDRLVDLNADRQTLVVAVGGGVIGDLAGFVAATYARGSAALDGTDHLVGHGR